MDSLLEELSKGPGQGHEAFAAPSHHEEGTPVGRSSPSAAHWLTHSSTAECFGRAGSVVPDVLQVMTLEAAGRWEMRPEPVLATLIHVLAGLVGTRHRLRRAHLGFSCPFSLAVCGEAPSRQNWIEFLAEPWLGPIRQRIRMHQAFGSSHFIQELKDLEQTSALAYGSVLDRHKLAVRARMNLAPCALERSPLPGALLDALKHSCFRTVVSVNGGVDPMVELHSQGKKSITELCRILEMAWRDMDLPSKGPVPRRGTVHLLWRTDAQAARRIIWSAGSPWNSLCPPVLLMREGPPPSYLAPLSAEAYSSWMGLCEKLAQSVESLQDSVVWSFLPEADAVAAAFCREIGAVPPELAPLNIHHFSWLHELVIRLGMLLTILDTLGQTTPTFEFVIGAEKMEHASVLARWLAREHLDCLKWLQNRAPDDRHSDDLDGIDNIDIDQLKAAILERLASKGPLSRRELSRSFHEMPARARDCAISGLKKAGLVVEMADGRISSAEQTGSSPPIR